MVDCLVTAVINTYIECMFKIDVVSGVQGSADQGVSEGAERRR